jgi:prevent-host-death family protein
MNSLTGLTKSDYIYSMLTLTLSEAKATFSAVVERVEAGEEVLITKMGKPVVKLSPFTAPTKQPIWGAMQGHDFKIAPDFDVWSEDMQRALGMLD